MCRHDVRPSSSQLPFAELLSLVQGRRCAARRTTRFPARGRRRFAPPAAGQSRAGAPSQSDLRNRRLLCTRQEVTRCTRLDAEQSAHWRSQGANLRCRRAGRIEMPREPTGRASSPALPSLLPMASMPSLADDITREAKTCIGLVGSRRGIAAVPQRVRAPATGGYTSCHHTHRSAPCTSNDEARGPACIGLTGSPKGPAATHTVMGFRPTWADCRSTQRPFRKTSPRN